jgi:5-methylcytosine-specific restriction endonuclease McrA
VLWHLRENERRMLFAQMGYRDLKEYCVKELKYSEGSAWRRISAMRLLKEIPEVEAKIQTGELNLTQVTMAQSHFREVKATLAEKREILLELQDRSKASTERILAERKPEGTRQAPKESEKAIRGGNIELTLFLDATLQSELEEIQFLLGKHHSKIELIKMMTKQTLETLRKKANGKTKPLTEISEMNSPNSLAKRKSKSSITEKQMKPSGGNPLFNQQCKAQPLRRMDAAKTVASPRSRYIPASIRREIRQRDGNRCQYKHAATGRQCDAKLNLQIEHRWPFAKGGDSSSANLHLLCSAHNRLRAVQQFGTKKMQEHLPSLR